MRPIDFTQAEYALAAHYPRQWPPDRGVEIAFAGRSNVGKSSALNAITNQNRLAKTSKTPGRTQQIVFFDVGETIRLVDLPGYGYAKAPKELRRHWEAFITAYLYHRQCLKALIIPMDIRRPLTDLDMSMLECCQQIQLTAHILLTKADKVKHGKAVSTLHAVVRQLKVCPGNAVTVQLFSASKKRGIEEARQKLTEFCHTK